MSFHFPLPLEATSPASSPRACQCEDEVITFQRIAKTLASGQVTHWRLHSRILSFSYFERCGRSSIKAPDVTNAIVGIARLNARSLNGSLHVIGPRSSFRNDRRL
jgi:hypothetical protein